MLASIPSLVAAGLILFVGLIIARMAYRATDRFIGRMPNSDAALRSILAKLAKYVIVVLAAVAALGQLGIQMTSVLAALGAIGLAIGLALQGTLSNVAAGIMLLWLRPFRIGDIIQAGNANGTIEDVGLFVTRVKTLEGCLEFVPNSEIWNTKITNFTSNGVRMVREVIGIAYEDDVAKAKTILMDAVAADDRFLGEPAPKVLLTTLGDSSVSLEVRAWAAASDWAGARFDFIERAKKSLEDAGISIPFPQQDIYVKSVPVDMDRKSA